MTPDLTTIALSEENIGALHSNQRLLVEELLRRGIAVQQLVPELELIEASLGEHRELFLDRDNSLVPYHSVRIAGDKFLTKQLLVRAGVSVCHGGRFYADQKDRALAYFASINRPVVVKPSSGSHGFGLHGPLRHVDEVEQSFDSLVVRLGKEAGVLIEEYWEAPEFRVLVSADRKFAVLRRDPPVVFGDGRRTVIDLIEEVNANRLPSPVSSACPILVDSHVEKYLAQQGLALKSVPKSGESVQLRCNSNIACGGSSRDMTEEVSPSLIEIAWKAMSCVPGLRYAGVDILTHRPAGVLGPDDYRVLEVNSNPGLKMHRYPTQGAGRSVARILVDLLFPETVGAYAD